MGFINLPPDRLNTHTHTNRHTLQTSSKLTDLQPHTVYRQYYNTILVLTFDLLGFFFLSLLSSRFCTCSTTSQQHVTSLCWILINNISDHFNIFMKKKASVTSTRNQEPESSSSSTHQAIDLKVDLKRAGHLGPGGGGGGGGVR